MARKGLVHEEGTHRSQETGERRILWAAGPSPDWKGEESALPSRSTGPRNKKLVPDLSFTPFLPSELRPKLAEFTSVEQLAKWLNEELMNRVTLSYE